MILSVDVKFFPCSGGAVRINCYREEEDFLPPPRDTKQLSRAPFWGNKLHKFTFGVWRGLEGGGACHAPLQNGLEGVGACLAPLRVDVVVLLSVVNSSVLVKVARYYWTRVLFFVLRVYLCRGLYTILTMIYTDWRRS